MQSKQAVLDRIARRLGRPLTIVEHKQFDATYHARDMLWLRARLLRRGFVSRIQRNSLDRPLYRLVAGTGEHVSLLDNLYVDRIWPQPCPYGCEQHVTMDDRCSDCNASEG